MAAKAIKAHDEQKKYNTLTYKNKLDIISNIQLGSMTECLLLGPKGIKTYLQEVVNSFRENDTRGYQDLEKLLRCYIVYGKASNVKTNFTGDIETLIKDPDNNVKEILGDTINIINIRYMPLVPSYISKQNLEKINEIYICIQFLNYLKIEPINCPYFKYVYGSFTNRVHKHNAFYTVLYSLEERPQSNSVKWLEFLSKKTEYIIGFYFIIIDALYRAAHIGVNNFSIFNADDILIREETTTINAILCNDQKIVIPFIPLMTNFTNVLSVQPVNNIFQSIDVYPGDIKIIRHLLTPLIKNCSNSHIVENFIKRFPEDLELTDDEIKLLEDIGFIFL